MIAPAQRPATGVLLAAGAGTRLGLGPKAFLDFGDGPLVARLARELLSGGCVEVVVVLGAALGPEAPRGPAPLLPPGCRALANQAWAEGLSTSFRAGADAVPEGHDALFALVDQPGLDGRTVDRLLSARSSLPSGVVAAAYPGPDGTLRRGHPLLMDGSLARRVAAAARGDHGARGWLTRNADQVRLIDCGDLDDGADIDTPEDLQRWLSVHEPASPSRPEAH